MAAWWYEISVLLCVSLYSYKQPGIALNCGVMLRECIKHESLARAILIENEEFYIFFEYVEMSTFDIASDAFSTFKVSETKSDIFTNFKITKIEGTFWLVKNLWFIVLVNS